MVVPHLPGIDVSGPRSIAFVFVRARTAVAIAILALALVAGGCGGSNETFTAAEADRALAALDTLESNLADGRCGAADSRVAALARQAQAINGEHPALGAAFAESVSRLQELVAGQCKTAKREPTQTVTGTTGKSTEPTGTTGTTEPTGGGAPEPLPTGGGVQPTPETPRPKPETPAPGSDQSGGVQPG